VSLRGLTLWRPWAASIVHGPKRVENRPWAPPSSLVRQGLWLALHAGKRWDEEGAEFILNKWHAANVEITKDARGTWMDRTRERRWPAKWTAQGIVGVARVVGAEEVGGMFGQPSDPWAFGPWCWDLADVRALAVPIPCRGAQMLWTLPPDVEAACLALIKEPVA
jgi:hypothetical protein